MDYIYVDNSNLYIEGRRVSAEDMDAVGGCGDVVRRRQYSSCGQRTGIVDDRGNSRIRAEAVCAGQAWSAEEDALRRDRYGNIR